MSNSTGDSESEEQNAVLAIGSRVKLRGDAEASGPGEIIDDFGPQVEGAVVDLGDGQQTNPRRWAVALDDGGLVFVDEGGLEPEGAGRATLEE